MQHIVNYMIVAGVASVMWLIILLHELGRAETKYLNISAKLHNLQVKYNELSFRFELLNKVTAASVPQDPVTIALSVLGLSRGASVQEIKNKYRSLVRQYHPDHNKSTSAPEKFKAITNAYKVLSK